MTVNLCITFMFLPLSDNVFSFSDGPSPRLCVVRKWPSVQGYGFNLHAEKGKPGQFIGSVDSHSPADAAGLLKQDKIIEVNEENVTDKMHSEVVLKITSDPDMVSLLVMDTQTEEYYRNRGIIITHNSACVQRIECPTSETGENKKYNKFKK